MNRRVLIIVSCALVLSACASYLVYRAVGSRVTAGKGAAECRTYRGRPGSASRNAHSRLRLKTAAWFGPPPAGAIFSPRCPPEPGSCFLDLRRRAGDGKSACPHRFRWRFGRHDSAGNEGVRGQGERGGWRRGIRRPGMRVDVLITGLPPGGNAFDGPKVRTLLPEHSGAFRRCEFPERPGRQAGTSAGCQSAGHAGPG